MPNIVKTDQAQPTKLTYSNKTQNNKSKDESRHIILKNSQNKTVSNDSHDVINSNNTNGHFTGKFINPNTTWKVYAIKWINGQEMVRIGTEQQWISIKYIDQLK